jgi:hypothetical protein
MQTIGELRIKHVCLDCDKLKKTHTVVYDNEDELIEKTGRFLITYDKGEVFAQPIWRVYDSNMKLQNIYMARIAFMNLTSNKKQENIILENLNINFESFYNYAKESNDEIYKDLTNKDTLIEFILNINKKC